MVNRLMASPRGNWWVSLPHDDKEGWARAKAVAPFWNPNKVTLGIGLENNISGKAEFDGQMYPLSDRDRARRMTCPTTSPYAMTKGCHGGL